MSAAQELRDAARELRALAEAAGEWPCAEWTQQSVRHIARNCDIECSHGEWSERDGRWVEHPCPAPNGGWERYETAPFVHAMSPGVALALADWLDTEAKDFDDNTLLDRPESGEMQPLNPEALWCDYCGGAVESADYPDNPCPCWSKPLAVARLINGGAA